MPFRLELHGDRASRESTRRNADYLNSCQLIQDKKCRRLHQANPEHRNKKTCAKRTIVKKKV